MSATQRSTFCQQCQCIKHSHGDLCGQCEALRQRSATPAGGAVASTRRSHVTADGVLRLTNPFLQPRPQAPAPSAGSRHGGQRASSTASGGSATHARAAVDHPRSVNGQHANGRASAAPRMAAVTPGRSFGPAIYGGLASTNGHVANSNSSSRPAAVRSSTPPPRQANGGSRDSQLRSLVDPRSRAAPSASSGPRDRSTPTEVSGPQLGERPGRRENEKDVIDLISSDEEETEAVVVRRKAERLRHEQAIARLALRSPQTAEESEAENEDVQDQGAIAGSASMRMEEEEKDEELSIGPVQGRAFDEIVFNSKDFPADAVATAMRRVQREPFSPASSISTHATMDEYTMEHDSQPVARAERRPTSATATPLPGSIRPSSAPAVASGTLRTSIPEQPAQTQQPQALPPTTHGSQPPASNPSTDRTQRQQLPPASQQHVSQPEEPRVKIEERQVDELSASHRLPPHVQQASPELPASQTARSQQSAQVETARVTTSSNVRAQDVPHTSSLNEPVVVSDPMVREDPKYIAIDDSDEEEEDEDLDDGIDYSAKFMSRIFDSVEFDPRDFGETNLNLGRRSATPVPPQEVGPPHSQPTMMESTDSAEPASAVAGSVPALLSTRNTVHLAGTHPPISASTPVATIVEQTAPSAPPVTPVVVAPRAAEQPPVSRGGATSSQGTVPVSAGSSNVNVLQPRKNTTARPTPRPLQEPTRPPLVPSSHDDSTRRQGPSSESPIIKRERAFPPRRVAVAKPALGYCSPDLLQFMRDSMYGDDDEDDDEETRAKLLQIVDLTNSTDESGDEEEAEDDEGDYFEILEQQPAVTNARPALGEVASSSVAPLGATSLQSQGVGNVVVARIKRTRAPRPKETCMLCEETGWIKSLTHCPTCLQYYHKRCARDYGDETVCWNCDLDGLIDDSEVTEDDRQAVATMFQVLRNSPASEPEADDEETKERDDNDVEETADAPSGSSSVSLAALREQSTRSMRRWKAFLEEGTAPLSRGFEETTNQITTELQDESSKGKYSKGFVTKEIVEQAMAEVVDHYAALQDREERAQREDRTQSPPITASEAPASVEPMDAVDGAEVVGSMDTPKGLSSTTGSSSSTTSTTQTLVSSASAAENPTSSTTQTSLTSTTTPTAQPPSLVLAAPTTISPSLTG